jgi:hypothetical protein
VTKHRPCGPPAGPSSGAPFPPLGPDGCGSPASAVLWSAAIPCEPSRRASLSFTRHYHSVTSVFVSPFRPDAGRGPGGLVRPPPEARLRWSRRASPVPGEPSCVDAVFSDPGGTGPPGLTVVRRGPRSGEAEGCPQVRRSRGSIARPERLLSTLRRWTLLSPSQDSLPAAGQALPGGSGYPQGSSERFP